MKHLKHLNKYLIKYRYNLILGVVITIIARVLSLIMPEYIQSSFNEVEAYFKSGETNSDDVKSHLINYIIIIIGSTLLSGFFTFLMRQTIVNVSRYIEFDLKNEIYKHYQKLSLEFYKMNRTGDLMNRISEDVGKVRMYVGPAIMYSVQTCTLFLCVVPLMFYTSPTLSIWVLAPLPILSILIYYVSTIISRRTTVVQEFLSRLSTFSQELFSGINIVKAYILEKKIDAEVEDVANDGRRKSMDLAHVQAWFMPLILLLIGISNILVIYIGGMLYIDGEIQSIGEIAKFTIYVLMLTWPVATVGWVSSIVQQAAASQKRINEFLKTEPDIVDHPDAKSVDIKGDIIFRSVNFTYNDTNIHALKDISFHIKKGDTIAFIGKVGSGKTTILDLISRVYDATSGDILLDGVPVKDMRLNSLRKSIGYVTQDSFLFSESIKDNIRFGDENATDEQIEEASKKACIHDSIINFKDGYQTKLGERGITLSGGQKQRLSIARTILKNPNIYLLDDCLSALDTETEEHILNHLQMISEDLTTIIITHRISSARYANQIFVLDNGRIIQQGSHKDLMKEQQGYYFDLYKNQSFTNNLNK